MSGFKEKKWLLEHLAEGNIYSRHKESLGSQAQTIHWNFVLVIILNTYGKRQQIFVFRFGVHWKESRQARIDMNSEEKNDKKYF